MFYNVVLLEIVSTHEEPHLEERINIPTLLTQMKELKKNIWLVDTIPQAVTNEEKYVPSVYPSLEK